MLILAIETSCDETAAAVVKDGREPLSNVINSQIGVHEKYGGVVPEIASRMHVDNIGKVVDKALKNAQVHFKDIDVIGVTYAPGLIGALLVGVSYAKALAFAMKVPLVAVHHIEGHICACYIQHKELQPPFLCLVASGGHSHIVLVKPNLQYQLIAQTLDDAAGESFDKAARALGLGYPGGPAISKCALEGNADAVKFPRVNAGISGLDFSFSGVKTSLINYVNSALQHGTEINKFDVAASFEAAIVDVLSSHLIAAAKKLEIKKIAIAGGVSANNRLREKVGAQAKQNGMQFYCPAVELCTDNACMIGCAAYYRAKTGAFANFTLSPQACAPLQSGNIRI